jgi:outer membrane protein TolC
MTEKQLQTQYLNGLNDWQNNRRTVETQMENYKLAEEVYSVAANQYREGVTSMSALLQDEMSMTQAQTAFVNAVYKYLVSELTLLKLTGQLDELTK